MTEGRLCSIDLELGDARDHTCARHFLTRQIDTLPNATVIAFGGKGQAYLRRLGLPHLRAHAFAPPGCNYKGARPSWEAAIGEVRRRRAIGQPGPGVPQSAPHPGHSRDVVRRTR
jgi:hypothetical protein